MVVDAGAQGVLGPLVGSEHGEPGILVHVGVREGIHHRQVGVNRDESGHEVATVQADPLAGAGLLPYGADPSVGDLDAHPVPDLSGDDINHPCIGQPHLRSP